MSNLLLKQQNIQSAQHQNKILIENLQKFIKTRHGQLLYKKQQELIFQYSVQIQKHRTRKIICILKKKKYSNQIELISKINTLVKSVDYKKITQKINEINLNNVYQNALYIFKRPNMFILRIFLQCHSFDPQKSEKIDANLQKMNNQYIDYLSQYINLTFYQLDRSNKEKQITYMIQTAKSKIDLQISKRNQLELKSKLKVLMSNCFAHNTNFIMERLEIISKHDQQLLNACLKNIQSQQSKQQKNNKESPPIVRKIKIKKQIIDKKWKAPASSNGILEKLKAKFLAFVSFNLTDDQISSKNSSKNDDKQNLVLEWGTLVRKKVKIQQQDQVDNQYKGLSSQKSKTQKKSYQNELRVLLYMRNLVSNSVASYYIQHENSSTQKTAVIYSEYYHKSLGSDRICSRQIIQFLIKLMQGIQKMSQSQIVHRDLKPDNILIDKKNKPKIIDFGSAWINNRVFNTKNQLFRQLRTTIKYNLQYVEAQFAQKFNMKPEQFERHKLFDIYAFGMIAKSICEDDEETRSELGRKIMINIVWLYTKCIEHNPNLRPEPQQILSFLKLLLKFFKIISPQNMTR